MLALDSIIVLDLNRGYPGAYGAMFLGDFGAQVIRVDPPGLPIPLPDMDTGSERFNAYYAPNRNKTSIIINLKSAEGREILYKLARRADVLIEGFRPGVPKRLQIDYETLKSLNPRLIYCSASGYGQDGPYAGTPGHDMNYCAISGALSLIGPRDGPPYLASNFLADMAGAGLHTVIGVLIALLAREKTGKGQFVDISYTDAVLSLMTPDISYYFMSGKVPRRGETFTTGGAPWGNVYKCKDGEYITLGCTESHLWANLCRAIQKENLIPRQNPATPADRDAVITELADVFLRKTRDEWFEFFKDKDTCVAPVYYLNETFSDPQILHRKMMIELTHPKLGKVKQIGMPIKLSETPGQARTLGVPPGANTDGILTDLGYTSEEINQLRNNGAVA